MLRRAADGLVGFVDRHYPGFRDLVEHREVSTPLTVEHFTGHPRGSVYGVPATPERFPGSEHLSGIEAVAQTSVRRDAVTSLRDTP